MSFVEVFLIGIGLSMDAFSVSICKGLTTKQFSWKMALTCGLWFGFFQALMPVIGYFLGAQFQEYIEAYDHWIAFGLLFLIGANMIREALFGKDEDEKSVIARSDATKQSTVDECGLPPLSVGELRLLRSARNDVPFKTMLILAIATSIDALAVGISFACIQVRLWSSVLIIGLTTFAFSVLGVRIGNVFGSKFEKSAEIIGGMILILIGLKILLEHLGVI